jgi:hypothetical protein
LTREADWAATWQHGTGWYRFGLGHPFCTVGSRSEGQERKGKKEGSPAGSTPVKAALELVDGDPPVDRDGGGAADEVRTWAASSYV